MSQGNARSGDFGLQILLAPSKATPADADLWGYWDTVGLRFVSITSLQQKAWLKTYFDTLYTASGGLSLLDVYTYQG